MSRVSEGHPECPQTSAVPFHTCLCEQLTSGLSTGAPFNLKGLLFLFVLLTFRRRTAAGPPRPPGLLLVVGRLPLLSSVNLTMALELKV
ncbi:unnamed protein product [Lota lota]